ncbi:MAG: HesA/MoeB/ThiF family protein [Psychrobacter sp.]|uniref:HesA/MoeB/ThiF family protein n=1 Tax=unclassified Psychrobacter TaxID=196806 RepID=UPI001788531E|nr:MULTISPECIES: HesA/MoeB/ThiF family protein [unclassified Psychrobacter]MBE0442313.1 HesA/MoeB/ThiF family protein [Psychrobacter sp. FME13]
MALSLEAGQLLDEELLCYARQILLDGWDIDAQIRLKSSRVVMIGAGGLGCPASETLVRAGLGHIELIDDDVIEASNLQRQTLFLPEDIGKHKALTAAQMLARINPLITACGAVARLKEDNAYELLNMAAVKPDLLLDCTDNFATRDVINRISVRYQIPLLSASAIAMQGQLALYEPHLNTGCYHCVFGSVVSDTESDERTCANSGVLASTTAIMGNLQANAALQYLGLTKNPLKNKLLIWDGSQMQQRLMGYRQDKECPVCSSH